MKHFYTIALLCANFAMFGQQVISFEVAEGYTLGSIHNQQGFEVTESDAQGILPNQLVSSTRASVGTRSFKNSYEPLFDDQPFPIFGATLEFDQPYSYSEFTISYDAYITDIDGSDFEFALFGIQDDEWVSVGGIGLDYEGYLYYITDEYYTPEYTDVEYTPGTWVNVKIAITTTSISYYLNNVLVTTIDNFIQVPIIGFMMTHDNYGYDAYYDNIQITTPLNTDIFTTETAQIYPNPTNGVISIKSVNEIEKVEIFNLHGQLLNSTSEIPTVSLENLTAGTYLVKMKEKNGTTTTRKVVKK